MLQKGVFLIYFYILVHCCGHPLEDYVRRPDTTYTYTEIDRDYKPGVTTIVVNMTSQTWQDESFSSQSIWFHYLIISVPDEVLIPDQSIIHVGVGFNYEEPPDPHNDTYAYVMRDFTLKTGAVSAYISNIPNQPITFTSDGIERIEDAIIAHTWSIYMNQTEPRDPDVLVYFPMVKAIVRSMDTVTSVAAAENPVINIDKYFVVGPFKRGWSALLTGATDDRVVGLVPMVSSLVNMVPNLHHHYESLGGWSWVFRDYHDEGITSRIDSPQFVSLAAMLDPYEMRANLTMPKYLIKAANDELLMLDDFQFYIEDFPGITNVFMLDNAVHFMFPHWLRVLDSVTTLFVTVYGGLQRDYMSWELQSTEETGVITAFMNEEPLNVTAWYCNTNHTDRRDFRWTILDDTGENTTQQEVTWLEMPVEYTGDLIYQVTVDAPQEGYTGFYIHATFPGYDSDTHVEISTEPNVVPSTYSFPPCSGAECKGTLV